jgi:hypothetical protein
MSMRRVIGFLVAPISVGVIVMFVALLSGQKDDAMLAILAAASVGYPVALVIGVPIDYLLFSEPRCRRLSVYVLTGIAISAGIILLVLTVDMAFKQSVEILQSRAFWGYSCIFVLACVTSCVIYGLIAYGTKNDD